MLKITNILAFPSINEFERDLHGLKRWGGVNYDVLYHTWHRLVTGTT